MANGKVMGSFGKEEPEKDSRDTKLKDEIRAPRKELESVSRKPVSKQADDRWMEEMEEDMEVDSPLQEVKDGGDRDTRQTQDTLDEKEKETHAAPYGKDSMREEKELERTPSRQTVEREIERQSIDKDKSKEKEKAPIHHRTRGERDFDDMKTGNRMMMEADNRQGTFVSMHILQSDGHDTLKDEIDENYGAQLEEENEAVEVSSDESVLDIMKAEEKGDVGIEEEREPLYGNVFEEEDDRDSRYPSSDDYDVFSKDKERTHPFYSE